MPEYVIEGEENLLAMQETFKHFIFDPALRIVLMSAKMADACGYGPDIEVLDNGADFYRLGRAPGYVIIFLMQGEGDNYHALAMDEPGERFVRRFDRDPKSVLEPLGLWGGA